ncbi:MAG: DUF1499 domain-containing protein [Gammaproteobacteria bacterium]|nr:DUF1499 domain-containing protein [Gammaproteobacteria bacterium]NND55591.1 DUF1499 domain-containing protein [Gammaproteobacteria bacterium]
MNEATAPKGRARGTRATAWAKWLFIIGVVLLVTGLIAPSAGISPMVAMLLITIGSLLFIVAGICGASGLLRSGGTGGDSQPVFAWLGVAAGIGALINTFVYMGGAGGAPIHDISTNTDDPPQFVEVAKLRGENDNPAEYAGDETAAIQKEAYPEIQPLVLLDPRTFVFETALQVAEEMGWEIVATDIEAGRIEATATTSFVGFKDDVVIRVRARSAETIVDVRSKSRVGRGDMGVNAERVRDFLAALEARASP